MPQADGIVSNASGAAVRADINNQLAALFTNHSGATEPATTYAYQFWADTTAGQLKLRNSSNTDWITLIELDGTTLMEDGTVSAPGLAFADDTNTGFYRPAADSLGIATNGTNAIYIDSSQQVGIGTTSPDLPLTVKSTSAGGTGGALRLVNASATVGTKASLIFTTTTNETFNSARIDGERDATGTNIVFSSTEQERARISSSGNVGIGTTSPGGKLVVSDGSTTFQFDPVGGTGNILRSLTSGGARDALLFDAAQYVYSNGATEYARIDSSGRLLVGTSTARANLFNSSITAAMQVEGTTDNNSAILVTTNQAAANGPRLDFAKSRGSSVGSNTLVSNGDNTGSIYFQGSDGSEFVPCAAITGNIDGTPGANDMPGRLVFYTTADGASSLTERMRIDSSGNIKSGSSCDFLPSIDAGFAGHADLGDPALRFEDAYVRDGVTTGSDGNYKSDIRELSDAERAVAVSCKSLLRAWKWTEAVDLKGDAARIHIGIVAQDLEQAFAAQGLDAHNYAMFCEDTWYEVDGKKEDDNGNEHTADSNGAVAVTRLSVRYHELLAFIIAAI